MKTPEPNLKLALDRQETDVMLSVPEAFMSRANLDLTGQQAWKRPFSVRTLSTKRSDIRQRESSIAKRKKYSHTSPRSVTNLPNKGYQEFLPSIKTRNLYPISGQPTRSSDFRDLYNGGRIRQMSPPDAHSDLSHHITTYPLWNHLKEGNTSILESKKVQERGADQLYCEHQDKIKEDMKIEQLLNHDNEKKRGYSRHSDERFPLLSSSLPNTYRTPRAHAQFHSKRRHDILYDKLYDWKPKEVTYFNLYSPMIKTNSPVPRTKPEDQEGGTR